MIASKDEICSILSNNIFIHDTKILLKEFSASDNKYIKWDYASKAETWLRDRILEVSKLDFINSYSAQGWSADPKQAYSNLRGCLIDISKNDVKRMASLSAFSPNVDYCIEDIERCYGYYSGYNWYTDRGMPNLFIILLTLKEGNIILKDQLDELYKMMQSSLSVEDSNNTDPPKRAEEFWVTYSSRSKTLLEQVFNYTTIADLNGVQESYWISGYGNSHHCIMSHMTIFNSKPEEPLRTIDIRSFDMKGFRITNLGDEWCQGGRVGDEATVICRSSLARLDRLKDAWRLAFQECPGIKSAF